MQRQQWKDNEKMEKIPAWQLTKVRNKKDLINEARVVSKSRPSPNCSSYLIATSSSAASSPIASKSLGTVGASGRPASRMNIAASSFDAASASQVKLKDGETCRMREKGIQETLMILNLSHGMISLLLKIRKLVGNHLQEDQQNSCLQNSRIVGTTTEHFLPISPDPVPYTNDVYNMVRKVYARPADDPMKYLDVNMAVCGIFMNVTLRAAIHLGNDHHVNLRNVQNSSWRTSGQLFGNVEKLISGQTETTAMNLTDSQDFRWISTSLLHSRAHHFFTDKVHVFSDSVLCLGRMGDDPTQSWKNKIKSRKSGTELTMACQVDIGRKQRRKFCRTLRNLVILYSVVPVPWREGN